MRLLSSALFFSLGLTIGTAVSGLGGRSNDGGGSLQAVDEAAKAPVTADRSGPMPPTDAPIRRGVRPETCIASSTMACITESQQTVRS